MPDRKPQENRKRKKKKHRKSRKKSEIVFKSMSSDPEENLSILENFMSEKTILKTNTEDSKEKSSKQKTNPETVKNELAFLERFMSNEDIASTSVSNKRRKNDSKVDPNNENEKNTDSLFSLISDKFQEAGFKEESLKRPEIINNCDNVIEDIYITISVLFDTSIENIEAENVNIQNLIKGVDSINEVKKELSNFSENIDLEKYSVLKLEEIIEYCNKFLESHLNYFSKNLINTFFKKLVKIIFDLKFLCEYFFCTQEKKSIKKMTENYKILLEQIVKNFFKSIPQNINDTAYQSRILAVLNFEKDFTTSIENNIHSFYYVPIRFIASTIKKSFNETNIDLLTRETNRAILFITKVYSLLERSSWKTKNTKDRVYNEIKDEIVEPSNVIYLNVKSRLSEITKEVTSKITFNYKSSPEHVYVKADKLKYSNEAKIFDKKFKKLTDYVLKIVSSYKKSVINEKILNLFMEKALLCYYKFIDEILYFYPDFMKIFIDFLISNCKKKEKKIYKSFYKKTETRNYELEELLIIYSNIALANEKIEAITDLLELEFENQVNSNIGCGVVMVPKLESFFVFLGFNIVLKDFSAGFKNLYVKEKHELTTFKSLLLKNLKERISFIEKRVEKDALGKILETVFLSLIISLEIKIFESNTLLKHADSKIFKKDLKCIYDLFRKYEISASVEDVDHVCCIKAFIKLLNCSSREILEEHSEIAKKEYPKEEEYYKYLSKAKGFPVCKYFSEETQSLTEIGLLKLISKIASKKTQAYAKRESKNISRTYFKLSTKSSVKFGEEDDSSSEISELSDLPRFESVRIIPTIESQVLDDDQSLYAISIIWENQKLIKNKWSLSKEKPYPYTDKTFKIKASKESLPQLKETGKKWRWASEWLVENNGWVYAAKFVENCFTKTKPSFIDKARTRSLVRFRIIDTTEMYDVMESFVVIKNLRQILKTVCFCTYKRTCLTINNENNDSLCESSATAKSISSKLKKSGMDFSQKKSFADSSQKNSKFDSMHESKAIETVLVLKNKEEAVNFTETFAKLIESTNFVAQTVKEEMSTCEMLEEVQMLIEETYFNEESITVEESIEIFERVERVVKIIARCRKEKQIGSLSFMFLSTLFNLITKVSEIDQIEPIVAAHYMQEDASNEGIENILNFGLPYITVIEIICSTLENLKIDSDSRDWKKYVESGGLDQIVNMIKTLEKWLTNYHTKCEDIEGIEETVCRLMETFCNLSDTLNRYTDSKINAKMELRKIMQQSMKNILAKVEKDLTSNVLEWEKRDWEGFLETIKSILNNEVEKYQNDILIPGFEDPCKNTIIPVFSKVLMICEKAIEKKELDLNFLEVTNFYCTIENMMNEWEENEFFSPKILENMKKFIPNVEEKIKGLLKHIVYDQYDIIVPWIVSSQNNESLLENGKFSSLYSDVFSYINNFELLFCSLLKKLPATSVKPEICFDFRDVFFNLVFKYVELIMENITAVEDILSESVIISVNRSKRNKKQSVKINVFSVDYNDLEFEDPESEEFEIMPLKEVCCKYSNLVLGLDRLKSINAHFEKEIKEYTQNANFSMNLEPAEYQEKIDEIAKIIAHYVIFIPLGNTLFGKQHYLKNEKSKLITEFEEIDQKLSEIIETIRDSMQIENSFGTILQAVFDVYINAIQWLLLGSTKHKFEKADMNEIKADFELFDIFKLENQSAHLDTFELKTLKLIISLFEKSPQDVISFHKAIKTQSRLNTVKNTSVNLGSKFIYNACNAVYFDPKDNQPIMTERGVLAVIEHYEAKETNSYFKKFWKYNKQEYKNAQRVHKIELNSTVQNVLLEFELIPKILEMDEIMIKDVSHAKINSELKLLRNFIQENKEDDNFNWKFYFSNKKTIQESQTAYVSCCKLLENFHLKYKACVHSEILSIFSKMLYAFGFLLRKTVTEFNSDVAILIKIIENSAKKFYEKRRKNFPSHFSKFKPADWDEFENKIFEFLEDETRFYSVVIRNDELGYPSEHSLFVYFELLGREMKEYMVSLDIAVDGDGFIQIVKILKNVTEYVKTAVGPEEQEGQEEYVHAIKKPFFEKLCKLLPDYSKELLDRTSMMLESELDKVSKKLESVMCNPVFIEVKTDETEAKFSKYCQVFEKMLSGYKRNVFIFIKKIPAQIIPSGIDELVFEYINKLISKFVVLNFPKMQIFKFIFPALKCAENEFVKKNTEFVPLFVKHLSLISKTRISQHDECFSISYICLKFSNLRFVNTVLQKFKCDVFERFESLGIDSSINQQVTTEINKETEKILKMIGHSFFCISAGETFFGGLLRKKDGVIENVEASVEQIKIALEKVKRDVSYLDYIIVIDSIFFSFLEVFKWILLDSTRHFGKKDCEVMNRVFYDCLELFSENNKRILKVPEVKTISEIVYLFENIPEENIRLYKEVRRSIVKSNVSAKDIFKILEKMDSKEAIAFVETNRSGVEKE